MNNLTMENNMTDLTTIDLTIMLILFVAIIVGHIYLWNLPRTNGRSLSTQKIIDHLKLDGER